MTRETAKRAARILALIQAREEGLLHGVTLQELADILEVGRDHRDHGDIATSLNAWLRGSVSQFSQSAALGSSRG